MVERQIHRVLVLAAAAAVSPLGLSPPGLVRRHRRAATTGAAAATESARGAVDARIVIAVHRDEAAPFVLRAALAEHAADRVAPAAKLVGPLVGGVGEVDQAPLGVEHDRSGFFRRQTVGVGQRLDDAARDVRRDLDVVERHHPPDRQLPVFGRRTPVRDARHSPLVVGDVAAAARLHDFGVGHRNAFVSRGCRAASLAFCVQAPARAAEEPPMGGSTASSTRTPTSHRCITQPGKTRSSLRQSFCAAAHVLVQFGAWFS